MFNQFDRVVRKGDTNIGEVMNSAYVVDGMTLVRFCGGESVIETSELVFAHTTMDKFLITNNVNSTYDKIFKICGRKYSDDEKQLNNGYMVAFFNLSEHIVEEIKSLKNVEIIIA